MSSLACSSKVRRPTELESIQLTMQTFLLVLLACMASVDAHRVEHRAWQASYILGDRPLSAIDAASFASVFAPDAVSALTRALFLRLWSSSLVRAWHIIMNLTNRQDRVIVSSTVYQADAIISLRAPDLKLASILNIAAAISTDEHTLFVRLEGLAWLGTGSQNHTSKGQWSGWRSVGGSRMLSKPIFLSLRLDARADITAPVHIQLKKKHARAHADSSCEPTIEIIVPLARRTAQRAVDACAELAPDICFLAVAARFCPGTTFPVPCAKDRKSDCWRERIDSCVATETEKDWWAVSRYLRTRFPAKPISPTFYILACAFLGYMAAARLGNANSSPVLALITRRFKALQQEVLLTARQRHHMQQTISI
jgi:hypothetical protein